jgi:hypothetical protein
MRTRILLSIVASLLIHTDATTANRCFLHGSVREEFRIATAVFSGRVVSEEYRSVKESTEDQQEGSEVLIVRLSVDRYWKGNGDKEVEMYTTVTKLPGGLIQSYAEDFHFEMGESYLVYAYGPPDKLRTDVCKRTAKLELARDDLRRLGKGKLPKELTDNSLRN